MCCETNRQVAPHDPKVLGDFANFLEDLKELKEAEALFLRSVAAPGAAATQYCNFAVMLTEQSRYEEAQPLYEKASELDPRDAGVAYNLGCFHAKQGHQEKVRRRFPLVSHSSQLTARNGLPGGLVAREGGDRARAG